MIQQTGARNRRILEGVVSGIAHYGNCFGVPTVGGECVFEESYDGNPLVNVFALGVFRHDEIFYGKATGVGNPVIYVGAKTGRDGIHGASMASAEFTEESKQKRPNVQVGDPFMEKLLLEACLEAMKTGAIVGIQDMGAAGLTSSTCEMGSRAGTGIEIDLAVRSAARNRHDALRDHALRIAGAHAAGGRERPRRGGFRVFQKWGLDAVTIGVVTDDGMLRVKHHGEVVAEIPNRALADEAPALRPPLHRAACALPRSTVLYVKSSDLTADLTQAARIGRSLLEALDLGAVRLPGSHQHARRAGRRRRDRPHQGERTPRLRCRSMATAATALSIRAKARS